MLNDTKSNYEKNQIRRIIKRSINNITNESIINQSKNVTYELSKNQNFICAQKIALYIDIPKKEISTDEILKLCYLMKKSVYLPKCDYKTNSLSMIKVLSYNDILLIKQDEKSLIKDQISGSNLIENNEELDLFIVPGLAFSRLKQRLGHGNGFYDKFFFEYFKKYNKVPYKIGLCFKEQLVDNIPTEKHDWNLDCVIVGDSNVIK